MDSNELRKKIEERLPGIYSDKGMEIVLEKVGNMDVGVRRNVEEYLNTGEIQDMEIEGFTLLDLMNDRNMNPLAAYLTLDWLVREPEAAKRSLEKGSDKLS